VTRHVRGSLFAAYVRIMRNRKGVDWTVHLKPEDILQIMGQVDVNAWYPMATYERLGEAILKVIVQKDIDAVRDWGRVTVESLCEIYPGLPAPGDPLETLMRFKVLRSTFFDFDALSTHALADGHALIEVRYHMGPRAEEAACYQTMGFLEGLLRNAGAREIEGRFQERSWAGDARTMLDITWTTHGDS